MSDSASDPSPSAIQMDAPFGAAVASAADSQGAATVAAANSNPGASCRCEVCGISGVVSNFYSPRFCSRECRYERNKGNHVLPRPDIGIITCRECGKVGSSTEFFSAKYCSKKCRYERGGRPLPQSRADELGASADLTALPDSRHKAKHDGSSHRHSISLPADASAYVPLATAPPILAPSVKGAHVSSFYHVSSAAAALDSTTNHTAATVAANWQLLVDYQPRDKDHAGSLPYLLDAVAAMQENIVRVSLECVQAETFLDATSRRLQELEKDINACVTGASDAASVDDRKSYYDIVRKMWADRALLQKDEVRMLEQLRKHQESKNKLRAQLAEKQQALLTLGLTVRRNGAQLAPLQPRCDFFVSCSCPGAHAGVRLRAALAPKSTQFWFFDRILKKRTAL